MSHRRSGEPAPSTAVRCRWCARPATSGRDGVGLCEGCAATVDWLAERDAQATGSAT